MEYKLHHIGIATDDIARTSEQLILFGYSLAFTQYDSLQNVNVSFLYNKTGPLIELIGEGGVLIRLPL